MTNVAETVAYTEDELEAMLAQRKRERIKKEQKEREAYEKKRDFNIRELMSNAIGLADILSTFKTDTHKMMDDQFNALSQHGGIRANSKGGFTVYNSEGTYKITRTRSTKPIWDERSAKAIELIADFLKDTVKKRDVKTYEVLMTFIQRNQNGDLEYSKVMDLMQHRDKWEDERWVKGLQLIEESYSVHLRGYGYEFYRKDAEGKWEQLQLSFSAIQPNVESKTETNV